MKKIIFIALLFLTTIAFETKAQTSFKQTVSNPTGVIVNTASDTMNLTLSQGYKSYSIQPIVVRNSGTAAGTATLYASLDGVNYVATGDTYTLTNVATNTTLWTVSKPAKYLRIIVGGATTVNATCSAKFIQGN